MNRTERDRRRRQEAEERRRAEGWQEVALPGEADGIALAGWGRAIQGTPEALYALAVRVLDAAGMPHMIPQEYADALAGAEVCAVCGEIGCRNC